MKVYYYHTQDLNRIAREWHEGTFPGHFLYGATHLPQQGIDVVMHRHKPLTGRFRLAWYVMRQVLGCKEKFDAIYCSQFGGMELIIILHAIGLYRKPIIAWQHPPIQKHRSRLRNTLSKLFYRGFDHLFMFSDKLITESVATGKVKADKVCLGHWGPDLVFYDHLMKGFDLSSRRGFISTGKEKRDFPTLIQAFSETGQPISILLNHTNGSINYDRIIGELGTPMENVHIEFLTELCPGEIAQRVNQSQCVAICCMDTNYTVGLTTLVEAYALALPVITSRNSAFPIDVEEEGIGIAVDYGDTQGWKDAINYMSTHPEEARRMGIRARLLAEQRFNLDILSKEVADKIKEIVEHR